MCSIHIYIYIYIYMCVCVCVYVYTLVCLCMCVRLYIHTYIPGTFHIFPCKFPLWSLFWPLCPRFHPQLPTFSTIRPGSLKFAGCYHLRPHEATTDPFPTRMPRACQPGLKIFTNFHSVCFWFPPYMSWLIAIFAHLCSWGVVRLLMTQLSSTLVPELLEGLPITYKSHMHTLSPIKHNSCFKMF